MSLKNIQSLIATPNIRADTIMKCALGIRTTEIEAYCAILTGGPATVQEMAESLGKSRPTAQRILQNLVEKGLAIREENLIGLGGYQYVYSAVSPEGIKTAIKNMLERWYTRMLDELEKLPEKLEEMGERCLALKSLAAG